MSEKDDIMGLAFLVGDQINNLKRNTLGDGKYIHQGLEKPADFVRKIASHDISHSINSAKLETAKKLQSQNVESNESESLMAKMGVSLEDKNEMIVLLKEISKTLLQINNSINDIKQNSLNKFVE